MQPIETINYDTTSDGGKIIIEIHCDPDPSFAASTLDQEHFGSLITKFDRFAGSFLTVHLGGDTWWKPSEYLRKQYRQRFAMLRQNGEGRKEAEEQALDWWKWRIDFIIQNMKAVHEGEVYGYRVLHHVDGDQLEIDSCWGYIGDLIHCKESALESASWYKKSYEEAGDLVKT